MIKDLSLAFQNLHKCYPSRFRPFAFILYNFGLPAFTISCYEFGPYQHCRKQPVMETVKLHYDT